MKVPFLYQYLHSKLRMQGNRTSITPWEFREFASQQLKIKKEYALIIVKELEEMKLIRWDKKSGIITVL